MKRNLGLTIGALLLGWWAVDAQMGRRALDRPLRFPARGMKGAVAAGTDTAADAGMRLFYLGGNAVDAGVSTMFAASMVEYSHFGFGGEAPILIRTKDGRVIALAGVGTMPKAATAEFFRNRKMMPGEVQNLEPNGLKGMVPVAGLMPALVPGMVEAGLVALREYGVKSFAEVIQPAIELADGTPLDEQRAGSIMRSRQFFELWPTAQKTYLPGKRPVAPGMIFSQPDMARTLRAMVAEEARALKGGASRQAGIDAVRDYFYRGAIARKIDEFSKVNGGLLRYEDLAAFRLTPEEPVSTTYRGYTVYKPGFWSQGPTMIETLNVLESYDLAGMQYNSAKYVHTVVEAMKLGYADRDTYYGDPKFAAVPAERLLSKAYGEERRKDMKDYASMEFLPGEMSGKRGRHPAESEIVRTKIDDALMARDTTCVNAADADGLVFSATPSGAWLPSVIAGDTGIPLTQRAQSFLLVEGHPNELAGGKRPRVTLSPTLVTREGKPYLALSTPGGDNQDQALLQLILNVVDFGMNAQMALEAPRFQTRHLVSSFDNHAMNPGDLLLDDRIGGDVAGNLTKRGHKTETRSRWASGSAPTMIRFTPAGVLESGAGSVWVPGVEGLVIGSLFAEPKPLAARLAKLAARGIFIGTSSWKYEGWLGSIYSPERYVTRGKFSQKKFDETCLAEYAETFPIVCGDFSFYQFPSDEFWRKLFGSSPSALQFAFKVPEEITCKKWPVHARYGQRAGLENENFLNAEAFTRLFYEPLLAYGGRAALFIFEFGTFSKTSFPSVGSFLEMLDGFLSALPEGPRYSVEIRNAEYLCPEYFAVLRANGVAHVFNAWTRMPDLPTQTAIDDAYTAGFTVTRALLRRGRTFEEGVSAFAPYREVQDPIPETRDALRALIQKSLGERRMAYIFVNNRLEGNAPGTIEAVVDSLED